MSSKNWSSLHDRLEYDFVVWLRLAPGLDRTAVQRLLGDWVDDIARPWQLDAGVSPLSERDWLVDVSTSVVRPRDRPHISANRAAQRCRAVVDLWMSGHPEFAEWRFSPLIQDTDGRRPPERWWESAPTTSAPPGPAGRPGLGARSSMVSRGSAFGGHARLPADVRRMKRRLRKKQRVGEFQAHFFMAHGRFATGVGGDEEWLAMERFYSEVGDPLGLEVVAWRYGNGSYKITISTVTGRRVPVKKTRRRVVRWLAAQPEIAEYILSPSVDSTWGPSFNNGWWEYCGRPVLTAAGRRERNLSAPSHPTDKTTPA